MAQEWQAAERSNPTSKAKSSEREDIPHVQGRRNPRKTVGPERGHQRADRLKPQSQTTSHLITWTTASSDSMTLGHAMWGHPRQTGHGGEV